MKCKLLLLYFLAAAFLIETNASPRKKKKNTDTVTHKTETAYEKLFKKGETKVEGLITLHRVNNQLYFEFPLQLLNKEMLLGSTVSEISDNGDAIVGQKPKDPLHIQFTKIINFGYRNVFPCYFRIIRTACAVKVYAFR